MRMTCLTLSILVATTAFHYNAVSTAAALPAMAFASKTQAATIQIGDRWYRDDDDGYAYPREYDLPPAPPVVRVVPAPPAIYYEPPVYGWITPPRPASCGKYRYWNGEYCADARYDPPYVGPRW